MQIAGEMQVDIRHGHDLRVTAARRAALDAEHGSERRFPQREADLFAELRHTVGESYRHGRLALSASRGVYCRNQHKLGFGVYLFQIDFRFVLAVKLQLILAEVELFRDYSNISDLTAFRNFNIG